jgi:hypothetical protein
MPKTLIVDGVYYDLEVGDAVEVYRRSATYLSFDGEYITADRPDNQDPAYIVFRKANGKTPVIWRAPSFEAARYTVERARRGLIDQGVVVL